MRIIAIDPGYDRLGVAVLEKKEGGKESLLFSECFVTDRRQNFSQRLVAIARRLREIIELYSPTELAIETLFVTKNQKTAMRVSEARGAIICQAADRGMGIFEFSPPEIKLACVGDGRADKKSVIFMIEKILGQKSGKIKQDDEYDAIAVGLTYFATVAHREKRRYPQG